MTLSDRTRTLVLRSVNERYTISDLDMGKYTISATHLNPYQETKGHQHDWEEGYYFACGVGRMLIGEEMMEVQMGEFKVIPSGVFHQVFNNNPMTLSFVCIWSKKEDGK